jgi:hypothetical protein
MSKTGASRSDDPEDTSSLVRRIEMYYEYGLLGLIALAAAHVTIAFYHVNEVLAYLGGVR